MSKSRGRRYLKPAPEPPAIRDAMAKAADREERNLPVYDFSSGNIVRLLMEYNLFESFSMKVKDAPEQFRPIAQAIIKGMEEGLIESPQALAYSATGGTELQKQTVVNYFKDIHGVPTSKIDNSNVMVTAGGQQAMAAALRSISPQTKVLASRWEYAPVTGIASDAEWTFEKLPPTNGLGFSLESLETLAEEGSVFYTSMPNNPSGYTSPDKLEAAIEIMEDKNGAVIWDAPYLFTMFEVEGGKARFDPEFIQGEIKEFNQITKEHSDSMCILSSISKTCLAAGLRFGFAYACEEWIQNMNAIVGRENLSSPTLSFIVGDKILKSFLEQDAGAYEWVSKILANRVNYLLERDIPLILPENGKFGALYVLMEADKRGTDFANQLIDDHGIVTVTGEPFYGDRTDTVRLSLVSVPYVQDDELWKDNVDKLAEVL